MNLIDAILDGDNAYETVKRLLRKGAEIDDLDEHGATALMRAAEMDQTKVVRLLLDQGADVSIVDDDGRTALDYAMEDEVGDLLFEAGCQYGGEGGHADDDFDENELDDAYEDY